MREKRKKRELERSRGGRERERERERERAKGRHAIIFISFWSSWVPLGCLLGASWVPLGASWGPLGGLLGPLGPLGGLLWPLVASWVASGRFRPNKAGWGPLIWLQNDPQKASKIEPETHQNRRQKRRWKTKVFNTDVGRSWGELGQILGRFGSHLGGKFIKFHWFSYYFLKNDVLEDKAYPRAIQEPKRAKMEPTWGPKGVQNGAQEDPKREQKRRRKMR